MSTGGPHKQCVCLCSKYKEMYGRILKSLNIVNLYRGMSKLKLKINAKVPWLLLLCNRGTFAFILSFNLDIPRYKFTILKLFNILPYISLYFELKQRHTACAGPL